MGLEGFGSSKPPGLFSSTLASEVLQLNALVNGKLCGGADKNMVIIVVFGGLVAGGAIFALFKSSSKLDEKRYTQLNIG